MKNIIVEFIITKWERLSAMLSPSSQITHHDIQWRKDAMKSENYVWCHCQYRNDIYLPIKFWFPPLWRKSAKQKFRFYSNYDTRGKDSLI